MNPFQNTLPTQFKIPFQNTLPTQQMNPFYWTLPTQQMLSFQRTQLTQQKINDRIQNTQKRLKALQSTSIYQTPNMQQGISMYQNVPIQISPILKLFRILDRKPLNLKFLIMQYFVNIFMHQNL